MADWIVEPCLVQSIKRGLKDVVNRAREHAEEHGGFSLDIDRKEFNEAATWIERYVNWSEQYGRADEELVNSVCRLKK